MTLEEMKKTIKERENIRKVSGAIKIGTLLATYLVWKSKNMTPFTEDMLKYYVPAIETVMMNELKQFLLLKKRL